MSRSPRRDFAPRRKRRRQNRTGLWVGLGIGGAMLIAGIAVLVVWMASKDSESPQGAKPVAVVVPAEGSRRDPIPVAATLSPEMLDGIKMGMTVAEVETVLGLGQKCDATTVSRTVDEFQGKNGDTLNLQVMRARSWRLWRDSDNCILVGFAGSRRWGEVASYCCWMARNGQNRQITAFGIDLDLLREFLTRNESDFAKTAWARGPDIRKTIVGKWADERGTLRYVFNGDGTMTLHFTVIPHTVPYRFVADDTIEYQIDTSKPPKQRIIHVNAGALVYFKRLPNGKVMSGGYFTRSR